MEFEELIENIREYTKRSVKQSRFEHSERVAELASRMGRLYNVDSMRCYFAGIAHDMCKNLDDEEMLKTAVRDGRPLSSLEAECPSLLHGRAAAVLLQENFGVTDAEVLQAVALHTLGGKYLCDLAKIIFVADKIEIGRPQSSSEYIENLLLLDLNRLTYTVLKEETEFLHSKGKSESPITVEFMKELEGDLNGI